MKSKRQILILFAVFLIALSAGCSGAGGPAAPTPANTPARLPSPAPSTPAAPAAFTVTGEIMDFSGSAGKINLKQTLEGFGAVALTDETAVYGVDGMPFEPKGFMPGMQIEAKGTADGAGSLNAATIRIIAMPQEQADPDPLRYARIQIAEGGLTLEVPASWTQPGSDWAWRNPDSQNQIVGVSWNDRAPGWEITSMLPNGSVNKDARPLPEIEWGQAIAHTVEVYDSAASTGQLAGVEYHVLVLGEKRAFDFFTSAKTESELQALIPIVLHMADSSQVVQAAGDDAAGKVVDSFIKAVQARDIDKAMSFWTLDRPDQPKDYASSMRSLVSTWIQEQPHWAIAGLGLYTGRVAPGDYRPMDESDARVDRATVKVRLGNLDGAFGLLKLNGAWLITGWMQP